MGRIVNEPGFLKAALRVIFAVGLFVVTFSELGAKTAILGLVVVLAVAAAALWARDAANATQARIGVLKFSLRVRAAVASIAWSHALLKWIGGLKERDKPRLRALVGEKWQAGETFGQISAASFVAGCWPHERAEFVDAEMAKLALESPRPFAGAELLPASVMLGANFVLPTLKCALFVLLVALVEWVCIHYRLLHRAFPIWTVAAFAGLLLVHWAIALKRRPAPMQVEDGVVVIGDGPALTWDRLARSAKIGSSDAAVALKWSDGFADSVGYQGFSSYPGRRYALALALAATEAQRQKAPAAEDPGIDPALK